MIKLIFTNGRETISFEVSDRVITYKDRRFTDGFTVMPLTTELNKKLLMPRINRIPVEIVDLIRDCNHGKNLEEYQNAKDDEELATIIKRDAASKGCVFQKRIDIENTPIVKEKKEEPIIDNISKDNQVSVNIKDTIKEKKEEPIIDNLPQRIPE